MNKLMRTAASRKGVSMMELVIALAIITLITAAAMSLLFTTTATEGKVARGMAAAEYGESTIECFRYAQNQDEFLSVLKKLDESFEAADSGDSQDGEVPPAADTQTYTLDKGGYQITVTAGFDTDGKDKLDFVAKDSEGKEILKLHYEK